MKTQLLFVVSAALMLSSATHSQPTPPSDPSTDIVSDANKFLATLSPEQRQKVLFAYDDATQRARWSNFPTGFVPRSGIDLKQMNGTQRDAAMKLLATVLSPMGLEKVNEIRQADDDFKAHGSKRGPGGRGGPPPGGRGGPPPGGPPPGGANSGPPGGPFGGPGGRPAFSSDDMFGSNLYYISFLGTPSTTKPWMLQFGGHHLALNITMAGDKGILTPTLTGAQPASFQLNGSTVRPLGRESDKALALMKSLDATERGQAVLKYTVADLVLGPGQDGKKIVPEGLKASAMTGQQRQMLLDLMSEWAGIMNERAANVRMAELKADMNETWFAWSGATTGEAGTNIKAYYRIQGPHLVIEYAPQQDEPTNHVHTIYRDPTNDYGSSLTHASE